MSGTVYGLGIGPGDPDLITVKARDVLARADVIAYPAPDGGDSLVRAIAAPHIAAGRREIVIATPMAVERFPAMEVYDRCADEIAAEALAGRAVAVLCEGDPFLYGSFMYVFERLSHRVPVVVVPGVSSLGAAAAAAGVPLVSRNEVLCVLPAPLAEADLEARLRGAEAAAIMKVGRHLPKVRRVLTRLGLAGSAWYVERATMANQRVLPLADLDGDEAPYFSLILTRREPPPSPPAQDVPRGAAVVALTQAGARAGRRLQSVLPGSAVHGLSQRVAAADVRFADTMAHLRSLFAAGTPVVGLCAAGVLVRAVAPLLTDKRTEPPVVAVAEDLSVAVPLLGGHRGANAIARAVAAITGASAAITTGGDARFGLALDAPPAGWRVVDPAGAKAVAAALLAGDPVALRVEAGDAGWLTDSGARFTDTGAATVLVTDRDVAADAANLVYHPPVLAVGVGCERGADADAVTALVHETLRTHGLSPAAVACVVSIDVKADEAAVHAAARALGVPARFFPAATLEAEAPRLRNPSDVVFREVGCHGVAEGAALAAVGSHGELIVEKTRTPRATCAVARAARCLDPDAVGRPQGHLAVVGIGPGTAAWRTPEATHLLSEATDAVGYGLYLDLAADALTGAERHEYGLGDETARVVAALDLAATGRRVALVSSGDAGIYGMATLVFELLERERRDDWNRVAITVAPGVSALQAAAARAGAPLGHDFCAISLSDLLTPREDIERRLCAAADGDFVVALYNPVSRRRRTLLDTARDILLGTRPADTPVVLARNLGRADEAVELTTLAGLTVDRVDMLTLVLVGSSYTRAAEAGAARWTYTPRGYDRKAGKTP